MAEPQDTPQESVSDDWNLPGSEEDQAVREAFMRAQEASLRKFWEETRNDNL